MLGCDELNKGRVCELYELYELFGIRTPVDSSFDYRSWVTDRESVYEAGCGNSQVNRLACRVGAIKLTNCQECIIGQRHGGVCSQWTSAVSTSL
jgi:hypothetical protein